MSQVVGGVAERLAGAGLWSISGKLAAKLLDLGTLVVLTNILLPADFGVVAQAMAVILIVDSVTSVPVREPILRIPDPARSIFDTAFTLAFFRGVLLAALIVAISYPLAAYFQEPRLPPLLWALSSAPILRGCMSPRMVEFVRRYDMRPEAAIDILSKLVALAVVTVVALATRSYWAIAAGTITTTIVLNAASFMLAPYMPRLSLRDWKSFVDVLGWNTVTQLFQALVWQIDQLLLGRYLSNDLFGRYAVARNVNEIPQQAISVPLNAPLMTSFAEAGSDTRRREIWLKAANTMLFVVGPLLIVLSALADQVVFVIAGPEWDGAGLFLSGLALATLPNLPGMPLNPLAISMFRSRIMAQRVILQFVVTIPIMIVMVMFYGAIGAILAKALSASVMAIVIAVVVANLLDLPIARQARNLWRTVAGLVVMGLVLWGLNGAVGDLRADGRIIVAIEGLLLAGVAAIVYLATVFGLWAAVGRPATVEANILSAARRIARR